jgi:hypothetical protein
MSEASRKCLDCDGPMSEIKIIDKQGATAEAAGLEYAATDAERGFWSGAYPKDGKISTYLCQECGAVRMFGRKSG